MQTYIPTPIDYLLVSLLAIFMFSVWNGLINKQLYQDTTAEKKAATSRAWHLIGVFIRLVLGLIAFFAYSYPGAILAMIFAFFLYNKVINLVRGLPFNHYGESKFGQFTKKYHLDWILAGAGVVIILVLILFS